MIKRKETILSDKTIEKIIREIYSELDREPMISFNLPNYLKEFDRFLDSPKLFSGEILHNTINLSSKKFKYWPSSKIKLTSSHGKTRIEIIYKLFWIYTIFYVIVTIPFLILMINQFLEDEFGNSNPSALLIISVIFIAIPIFGRWAQNNLVKFLLK